MEVLWILFLNTAFSFKIGDGGNLFRMLGSDSDLESSLHIPPVDTVPDGGQIKILHTLTHIIYMYACNIFC